MNIIYLGRYNNDEVLTGPEKVASRIFYNRAKESGTLFIEYFFDGKKYGFFKKLFGKEKIRSVNGSDVLRLGLLSLFVKLVEVKPGLIHIISFERFALVAFIYSVFFKVKIIYNVHGLAIHENKFYHKTGAFKNFKDCLAEDIFIRYSDKLLLLSEASNKILNKYYNPSKRKIIFIKNGIDREFEFTGNKIFNDILKLVFISDVRRKEKGFGFLLSALEKYSGNMELHIVDRKEIAQGINYKNDSVKIFSYDKMSPVSLSAFLKDKDVFVSPAEYEPFGITCAECMSAGLVPVVTSETGASEIIIDDFNGYVFDYGSSEQLCKILLKLDKNAELRKKISLEAVKIYSVFNWEKIYISYKKIYEKILNVR